MTLEEYMRANGLTDRKMGRLIGVSHSIVVRYRSGQLRPSWDVLDEILRVTDGQVRPDSFIQNHPWSDAGRGRTGTPATRSAPVDPDDELDAVIQTQQVA